MKQILCIFLTLAALLCVCACDTEKTVDAAFSPFTYQGTKVALDTEAAPIISALGEYVAFAETNSCYGDGKDKVYQYQSFKLTTYSQKGVDYVLAVELLNDTDEAAITPEGVRVGDDASLVIAKYGDAKEQSDTSLIYEDKTAKTRLQFLLRDGKVTNIQYLKSEG